ncbi:MAG: lysophospholipid acyltransferase family protein [Fibrobacterota bacterium]
MRIFHYIHTAFFLTFLIFFMVASIALFIPLKILRFLRLGHLQKQITILLGKFWARMLVFLTGSTLEVRGKEFFPKDHRYCIVANHQGLFDIPLIMSVVPWKIAFIAKKELKKAPIIGWWMQHLGVVFLDRSSKRQAIAAINQGVRQLQAGDPLVIFPEGTRSKGGAVAPFKKGSMKLAKKSDVPVVPVSICGSYKIFEEKRLIQRAHITITVHPPVYTATMSAHERENLHITLHRIIAAGVEHTQ